MARQAKKITIVGCGPGSLNYLTPAALRVIESAEVLVGAARLLELFPDNQAHRIILDKSLEEVLDSVETELDQKDVAVVVTGDPGLFSLAGLIIKRFGRERCQVIPGISSVQTAFAKIGLDWSDARIISAHKKDPDPDPTLLAADKIAVLGGRERSLYWIAEHLLGQGLPERRIFVCSDLTMEGEQVREVEPQDLAELDVTSRTVVLLIRNSVLS